MEGPREFLRRYFIPHEGNDYKPHILQKSALIGVLFLLLSTFATVNVSSLLLLTSETFSGAILPGMLVSLTNDNRKDETLAPLKRSALLDQAAKLKAEDMAKGGYFAHQSPDGKTPWYWFDRVGYAYAYAGENLAVHFTDSDKVVAAWMRSPGHKANIMSGNYSEIGIGTARGTYKDAPTIFVVQLFGRPITEAERQEVAVLETAKNADFSTLLGGRVGGDATTTLPLTSEVIAEEAPVSPPAPPREKEENEADPLLFGEKKQERIDNVLVLSDIATASPLVETGLLLPAGTLDDHELPDDTTPFKSVLARPHAILSVLYAIIAILLYTAIVLSIVIEWRRQHVIGMVYGTGLLGALWMVLSIHGMLTSGVLIL